MCGIISIVRRRNPAPATDVAAQAEHLSPVGALLADARTAWPGTL